MDSLWQKTVQLPRFAPLNEDRETDVLIVGGGLAGILCAYMLEQAGVDYMLVEAKRLCSGVTGKTTAKVTAQHGLIYHRLMEQFGAEQAAAYLQINRWAVEEYQKLAGKIDCDFQEQDSFVYALDNTKKLEEEMAALERLGATARLVYSTPLPFPVAGAVRFSGQGQLHPLKLVAGIVPKLRIFEQTKVLELRPGVAVTTGGRIRAENILVATHFPMLNKHGSYFLKLHQNRSYVLALENVPAIEGMYVDEDESGMSFRQYGNTLLLGGGGHRTGTNGGGWRELEDFARRHWPKVREVARWATQDCMTLDAVPYIGRYSRSTKGLYTATGFNKWGLTSSMAAARVLTELVQGKRSDWQGLFSPSRTMMRVQLAANAVQAVKGLLTPGPRCPHMGCALKYNPQEHSWDCPCHGSRFTREGEVVDNPAADDKKM